MSVTKWVKMTIVNALGGMRSRTVAQKLAAIRKAAKCNAPTADIETMNAEIEAEYLTSMPPDQDELG